MIRERSYTGRGGKTIKVILDCEDTIGNLQLFGDFFAHPEEVIEKIEGALVGAPLSRNAISGRIRSVMEETEAVLYGITADDILDAILICAGAMNDVETP